MTNEELDTARAEEAWNIYNRERSGDVSAIAARLAREGWTPPKVVVDPDIGEANAVVNRMSPPFDLKFRGDAYRVGLAALKRGRELERAEAKPGLVWVKHDRSDTSPVPGLMVTVRFHNNQYDTGLSFMFDWWSITHYAIITPPEDK